MLIVSKSVNLVGIIIGVQGVLDPDEDIEGDEEYPLIEIDLPITYDEEEQWFEEGQILDGT